MWIVLDGTIHIRYFYTIDNKLITNQTSDKLFYGCNVVPIEIFVYSVRYFFSYLRIYEVSCSDLYGRCTGQYKFNGIGGVHDSSQPYNRDFYGMVSLPNHTQCDGLNTCTG